MKNTRKWLWLSLGSVVACALAMGVPATPVLAQGFNFSDFSSGANLQLNGNAARSGNVLRLTPADIHKVGSAWYTTAQPVVGGFTTVFSFRISPPSSPPPTNYPADGLAFVIQKQSEASTSAIGGDDSGIGYGRGCAFGTFVPNSEGGSCTFINGIPNSLGVEFDTFRNIELSDPNNNHVAVQSCGTKPNSADHGKGGCNLGGVATPEEVLLADGNPHTVVINYDAPDPGSEIPGKLSIYLDSGTPLRTVNMNLASLLNLGEAGTAFVGFTGSTGGFIENNDILTWSYSPHTGTTETKFLFFTPGTNVSRTATFDCPSGTVPCTDPDAHSMKVTVKRVRQSFTLVMTATKAVYDGICQSGNGQDFKDPDCALVAFGRSDPQPGFPNAIRVPLAKPYADSGTRGVSYQIFNPPPLSVANGPHDLYNAWNNDRFVPPPIYATDNSQLQMYKGPNNAPANRNITSYYNPLPNQVGIDQGVDGTSDGFSYFLVAYPLAPPPGLSFSFLPPISLGRSFRLGSTIPVKFRLTKEDCGVVTDANKLPNHVGFTVLDLDNNLQLKGVILSFRLRGDHYQLNLRTSLLKAGTFQAVVNSNLFGQKTQIFTLEERPRNDDDNDDEPELDGGHLSLEP